MKRLTVFAMTEKGHAVVARLLERYPGLVDAVVAARDKGLEKDWFVELAALSRKHGVRFHERTEDVPVTTGYALAVAWRWLVDHGSARLIVLHDSLLPKYRGFNPLVTALINGDTEIGVTALYATHEYDRGDIIAQAASTITYPIRIQEAVRTILANYEALADRVAETLVAGRDPAATPQSESGASYSLWRDEEDYFLDWSADAPRLRRSVDALGTPYKGAACTVDGRVARIHRAEALPDVTVANRTPGKVLFVTDSRPVVVCGTGLLRIDDLTDDETGRSLLPLPRFRVRFN
jgi:methionyl-tRNA formyltransferase